MEFALHHPKPTLSARLRLLRALALPLVPASAVNMLNEAEVFLSDLLKNTTIEESLQLDALEWLRQLFVTATPPKGTLPSLLTPVALRLIPAVSHVTSHSSSAQLINASLPCLEILVDAPGALAAGEGALVAAVCRAVNVRDGSKPAWRVMRKLLETAPEATFGYLASMLVRASAGPAAPHVSLLRGAVFFMGMAVWGSQQVPAVAERLGAAAALPYLAHALAHCRHVLLAYEVGLCLRRCLRRHEATLQAEWEDVLMIVEEFHRLLNASRSSTDTKQDLTALTEVVRDTIMLLSREELANSPHVPRLRLYYVLELHAPLVPQAALERLMAAKAPLLHPASERWQAQLKSFLHTFLVAEVRPQVRLRALVEIKHLTGECRWLHDEELAQLLLPHLESAVHDTALLVALKGLEVLEALATQLPRESTIFPILADLILRVAQSGHDKAVREASVRALVSLFEAKVEAPLSSAHSLSIFLLLLRAIALPDPTLRRPPLQCLARIRADPRGRISLDAFADHPAVISPYLTCALPAGPPQSSRLERAVLPLGQLAMSLVERLAAETSAALHEECASALKRLLLQTGAVAALDLAALAVQLLAIVGGSQPLAPFVEQGKNKTEETRKHVLDIFVRLLTYKRVLPTALRARLLGELRAAATDAPRLCPWSQFPLVATLVPRAFARLLSSILPASLSHLRALRAASSTRKSGGSQKNIFEDPPSTLAISLLESLQMLAARTPPALLSECARAAAKHITSLLADVLASRAANPYARRLASEATGTWTDILPPEARISLLQEIHALRSGGEGDEHAALLDAALDALHLKLPAPQPISAAATFLSPSLPSGQLASILFPANSAFFHWAHSGGLLSLRSGRYGWVQAIIRRPAGVLTWYMHLHAPRIESTIDNAVASPTSAVPSSPPALVSPVPRSSSNASLLLIENNNNTNNIGSNTSIINNVASAATTSSSRSQTPAMTQLGDPSVVPPPFSLSSSIPTPPLSCPAVPLEPRARVLSPSFYELGVTPEDEASLESLRTAPPVLLTELAQPPSLPPAPDTLGWLTAHQPLPSYDLLDDQEVTPASPSQTHPPLLTRLASINTSNSSNNNTAPPSPSTLRAQRDSRTSSVGSPPTMPLFPSSRSSSLANSAATPPLTRSPFARPTPSPSVFSATDKPSPVSPAFASPPRTTSAAPGSPPNSPPAEDITDDTLMAAFLHVYFLPLQPAPPLRLKGGEALERAVKVLDTVPTAATSRIGVIWVADGQTKEEEFLANTHAAAPTRYHRFISGLGQLVRLRGLPNEIFTGGLDYASDADGAFALCTRDAGGQVVFHVATLMPPGRVADKKRHIGNDLVAVFYLERNPPIAETIAQAEFDPETSLPGQLTHVWLIVSPLPSQNFHRVEVRRRATLPPLGPATGVFVLPDDTLAAAVRCIALNAHAAVELLLHKEGKASAPNVSERERQLRVIRERFAGAKPFEKSTE